MRQDLAVSASRAGAAFIGLCAAFVAMTILLTPAPAPAPATEPSGEASHRAPVSFEASAVPGQAVTPSPSDPVRVTSIPALLTALADDTVTEIVVANGTYRVSGAASKQADSLWIGEEFAGRTRPVLVRAETTGGVTLDGGGRSLGGISFQEGAHHQTWQGFVFANGSPNESGVIMFGGYAGSPAAHHITLRDLTIDKSVTDVGTVGYAVYFSYAVGGPHDILVEDFTVDNSLGGLGAALHFFHSDAANRNAWNVTVRRMHVTGTEQAIMLWDKTLQNIVIEDSTITGAESYAVRYEMGDTVMLRRVTSTGSGASGFYSSRGPRPPGVTFDNVSLH